MPFFDTEPQQPKTSDFVHEKLQSLEYRANCVSETLKLYSEKIQNLELRVSQLENHVENKK
ncbi:hypothetical protein A6F57_19645 [Alteromonas stellipolaris]|nr:hypothetical protein A6F57_19645 [Alteromonas stellipolaris]